MNIMTAEHIAKAAETITAMKEISSIVFDAEALIEARTALFYHARSDLFVASIHSDGAEGAQIRTAYQAVADAAKIVLHLTTTTGPWYLQDGLIFHEEDQGIAADAHLARAMEIIEAVKA